MREYLLTLCVTAAVTYLLTGPVRKFAIAAKAMPQIRARDVHREPTPRLGGIAMFGGLCAGLLVASQLTNIGELFVLSDEPRALLSGAGLIWLLGVLDDKWGVDALVKLGGQMIAAGVMVWQGLTILWLPVPGVGNVSLAQPHGSLLTVALIVITINAVNFVDGLDGLASGMVTIAAVAFFMYAYRIWYGYGVEAAAPATLFSVLLMGMCLGFLPHNMHPARIFMGDSGSMLIGLVLAAGAVSITGQVDPDLVVQHTGSERSAVHTMVPLYMPLLLPLTIIAIPVADLFLAILRRTWRGESPFAADKGHLHHRLLEIGHSHSRAVLIMFFWSALIAFGTVAFSVRASGLGVVLSIVLLSAVGLVVLLLPRFTPRVPAWAASFVPPRYRQPPEEEQGDPYGSSDGVLEAKNAEVAAGAPESGDGPAGEAAEPADESAGAEPARPADAVGGPPEPESEPSPALAGLNGATALSEAGKSAQRDRHDAGA